MPDARRLLGQAGGFAHRGMHGGGVPENSIAAFRAAIACGYGVECDVRSSRDGKPIVFHDADLHRMCGSPEQLCDLSSDELATRRLTGSAETIPTLSDLLALTAATTAVLIELKIDDGADANAFCKAVAEDIDAHAPTLAAVMSFDPRVSDWFARERPKLARGLIVDRAPASASLALAVRDCRADFLACSVAMLGSEQVRELRMAMPIACWTIRTAEQRRQAAVQVDALIWEADGRP